MITHCAVLYTTVVHSGTHTRVVLKVNCWFRLSLNLGLRFVYFCHFVPVLFAFVVLDLVSSVLCQEPGWEELLQNDPFCVEWDVKP